jgi:hypothetical protein
MEEMGSIEVVKAVVCKKRLARISTKAQVAIFCHAMIENGTKNN